ncbi:MAG: DNA repair protein RecN [Bacteroidales bacterium]|nr:DNA repair protein RecN [Bacteroidales bacterium]
MLTHLSIDNYALIEHADVDFASGFVAITGETGAGKSILLGALGLLLGQRAEQSVVREGGKCIVEALFDIEHLGLESLFEEADVDYSHELILRREVLSNGKSRAFANDTPVSLAFLRQIAPHLVDIHSQHQTLAIAESSFAYSLLDTRCDASADYAKAYGTYSALKRRMEELTAADAQARRDADYVEFQWNELNEARLTAGEQDELQRELDLLDHAEQVKAALTTVVQLFSAEGQGTLPQLSSATTALSRIAAYHPDIEALAERMQSARIELADIGDTIERLADTIDYNPQRRDEVSERLDLIYRLQHKHGVDSVEALIDIREGLQQQMLRAQSLDDEIRAAMEQVDSAFVELQQVASSLSVQRKSAAAWFEKAAKPLLADLGMPYASIALPVSESKEYTAHGHDEVRLLFNANRGGELSDIGKVASGGELSRLMLAIKCLYATQLATGIRTGSYIFDEIDSGVSGAVSVRVADMMARMSQSVQVVVITHLPQIAAKASQHFRVYKEQEAQGSATAVSRIARLTTEERVHEIAVMLSSDPPTQSAKETAKELMNVFVKPSAEGKSRSVCAMPRRENDS